VVDHEILYQQSCHEELQQLLAPKYTTEWVEFGFELQGIHEHAQWLTELIVSEKACLLHSHAEQSRFLSTRIYDFIGNVVNFSRAIITNQDRAILLLVFLTSSHAMQVHLLLLSASQLLQDWNLKVKVLRNL